MEAAARKKSSPVLMPERIGHAEDKRHDWVVDAEVGVTVEEVLDPSYWTHISKDMDPFDHIEVRADDGKWIANLIVIQCERTFAKVQLVSLIEIKQNAEIPTPSARHKIEFKGAHLKHAVIRAKDDVVLQSGFKTRDDADVWLRNYEKTI